MDKTETQHFSTALLAEIVRDTPDLRRTDLAAFARAAADGLASDIVAHERAAADLTGAFVHGLGATPAGDPATRRMLETVLANLEHARVGHAIVSAVAAALDAPDDRGTA